MGCEDRENGRRSRRRTPLRESGLMLERGILLTLLLLFASPPPACHGFAVVSPTIQLLPSSHILQQRRILASIGGAARQDPLLLQQWLPLQKVPSTRRTLSKVYSTVSLPILASERILPLTYMVLLSLQFAVQPILTKRYAPKSMIRSTYVLAQDLTRILIAASCLTLTGSWATAVQHWTWRTALWTAGVPSLLYALQNYCSLMAYQNLTPITYNVLNQTKTLSAAFWCFLLLRQRQSGPQMLALGILLLSALVMENVVRVPFLETAATTKPDQSSSTTSSVDASTRRKNHIVTGVVPVLAASLISGLAGAWIQRSLQQRTVTAAGNNSLFLTLQMSAVSAVGWTASLLREARERPRGGEAGSSWTTGWTAYTWLPILVNSVGGLLVGLVTKFSGVVPKGFALIAGMFLSGILQNMVSTDSSGDEEHLSKRVSGHQWVGGVLAAISVYLHAAYPVARR